MEVAKEVDRLISEFYKQRETQDALKDLREYIQRVDRDVHQLSNELKEALHKTPTKTNNTTACDC